MKRVVFMLMTLVMTLLFGSCAGTNIAELFSGEIRFGLRQGSINPMFAGDTVGIVRAFPSSTISLIQGRDSVYNLRSGDRLSVIWKPTGNAVMFCDITADTVSFIRR